MVISATKGQINVCVFNNPSLLCEAGHHMLSYENVSVKDDGEFETSDIRVFWILMEHVELSLVLSIYLCIY